MSPDDALRDRSLGTNEGSMLSADTCGGWPVPIVRTVARKQMTRARTWRRT